METTGETHQGILDLSFFKVIPNLTIMAPKDFKDFENMLEFAIKLKKPVVIRYPRGGEAKEKFLNHTSIQYSKCDILTTGTDVTIIAIGNQVRKAMNLFYKLKKFNIRAEVIDARFLKPFDKYPILKSICKTKFVVTIEDNTLIGGLGTEVKELIAEKNIKDVTLKNYGYPDVFVEHGSVSELEKKYKIDENSIFNFINGTIKHKREKQYKLSKKFENKNKNRSRLEQKREET